MTQGSVMMTRRLSLYLSMVLLAIGLLPLGVEAQQWGPCNFPNQPTHAMCNSFPVKSNWSNPASSASMMLTAVMLPSAQPPNTAIVLLNRGCLWDDPTESAFWTSFVSANSQVALIVIEPRGSGQSQPVLVCPQDQSSAYMPSPACATSLAADAGLYSLDFMATDLNASLNFIPLPGAGPADYILVADGVLETAWAQRFQSMFPIEAKFFSGFALSSFTAPEQYDFFESLVHNPDSVVRRTLTACESNPACAAQAGAGRDLQQLLTDVLVAAAQGTLPCNGLLAKALGAAAPPSWPAFYSQLLASLVASPVLHPLQVNPRERLALIPSLLYRILRCSATDVTRIVSLNSGINTLNANTTTAPAPSCVRSQPLMYHLLFNELVLGTPPALDTLVWNAARITIVQPPLEFLVAARGLYDVWPKYTVLPSQKSGYTPSVQTLLFSGNLDVAARPQLASYATAVTYTTMSQYVGLDQVPYGALYTSPTASGTGTSCAGANIISYFGSQRSTTPCAQNGDPGFVGLDFLATRTNTQQISQSLYGVTNPWEYTTPNTAPVPTQPVTTAAPPTPLPPPPPTPHPPPPPPPPTPATTTTEKPTETAVPTHPQPPTPPTPPQPTTAHPPTPVSPTTTEVPLTESPISVRVETSSVGLIAALATAGVVIIVLVLVVIRRRLPCYNAVAKRDYYETMYGSAPLSNTKM